MSGEVSKHSFYLSDSCKSFSKVKQKPFSLKLAKISNKQQLRGEGTAPMHSQACRHCLQGVTTLKQCRPALAQSYPKITLM